MSLDTNRIIGYIPLCYYWWSAPIQILIAIYLLWKQLGVAIFAGMLVMVVVIPINGYATKRLRSVFQQVMKQKDNRSKMMNEVLNGIRVLKMYAWEGSFADKVKDIRYQEMSLLRKQSYFMAAVTFSLGCAPIFVAMFTFLTYTLIDKNNVLDASKAFVSISLLAILRGPLALLPMLVTMGSMFNVSLKRLRDFLTSAEMKADDVTHEKDDENAITVKAGDFSWTDVKAMETLSDVNVTIKRGTLVAIVGRVGAGKSSLISALIGDMVKTHGSVNVSGNVAYVPQQAWIQNATVKDNILFSQDFDDRKYNYVIEACALRPDLNILPAADETEIGEKGINLSGGQKQRVSLARAVYADRDIYLMDDPLSAVDTHVGKHIFDNVIGPKGLLRAKTRVLVTHKVSLLPRMDHILVVKNGQVTEQGTYLDLMENRGEFAEFVTEFLEDSEELSEAEVDPFDVKPNPKKVASNSNGTNNGQLTQTETSATGSMKWRIYLEYLRAIGLATCFAILVMNVIGNGINVCSSLWLTAWADDVERPRRANDPDLRYFRLYVYAGLGLAEAIFLLISSLVAFLAALRASTIIHNKMLDRVIRAPMSFFDTTPVGRILNRFDRDVDDADTAMRSDLRSYLDSIFRNMVTFVLVAVETPYFLLILAPLIVVYYFIQRYYILTSIQLNRLSSTSRSPLYSHFSESVTGASSIRAFGVVDTFNSECSRKMDASNSVSILGVTASRWLSVRLEFLGNIIVFLASVFASYRKGDISPALAGLSISYAMQANGTLRQFVVAGVSLENSLVAIERCIEYTRNRTEAPAHIPATAPGLDWPASGSVRFQEYSTQYRDNLDLVLKDITFEIRPEEKIGIVGRTGAGKSSVTLGLFRLIEPTSGTILIDGVDIKRIGLNDLRSKLTIIPQDPILFTGTLRVNLDPFEQFTDTEIWTALNLAHLRHFVFDLEGTLNYQINEGGSNLSVGQKQLVCLARALLRKSKILVLDEATAAVDLETDELIQRTIRTEFSHCTIITIAHRLNTVLDYDRILVMDNGKVAEFDTPQMLLDNPASIFFSMAREAGLLNGNYDTSSMISEEDLLLEMQNAL
ncbi:ATP-binding cassette sub-family C member 3 [Halotydeus destructor]|nr:ATP-binding cassette sub-family C member 3 [Halotydeus destructor]